MFSIQFASPFSSEPVSSGEVKLDAVRRERLGPLEFLRILESDRENIKSSTFIPPELGDSHFGYFDIEYRTPIYK